MSILPLLTYNLSLDHPHHHHPAARILNQHLGHSLHPHHRDLLAPVQLPIDPHHLVPLRHGPYDIPWIHTAQGGYSGPSVTVDKDKFQVHLDVQQFAPEEITVKVTDDNKIVIEGKHDEKQDEHGYISRHFVRTYMIPEGHNIDKIESKLSSDGVLTITAPKIKKEGEVEHRQITIQHTGKPMMSVKAKQDEAKDDKDAKESKK